MSIQVRTAPPAETYGMYWLIGATSELGVNTISEPARRIAQKYFNTISYIGTNRVLDGHKPDTCYTPTCALIHKTGILCARFGFHARELMYPQMPHDNAHRNTKRDMLCYYLGIGWGFTLAYFFEPYVESCCHGIEMAGLRHYNAYHVTWQALPTIIPPITTWLLQKASATAVGWDAPQKQIALENGMSVGIDMKDMVSDPQIQAGARALISSAQAYTKY